MPKFKFLFRFSILSCTLTLLVNSLYSHQFIRIASNSTNIHYNNICCNENNNFNNKNIFEKHWIELDLYSFYKTNLSIYQGICLKIYDSCGKAFKATNVHPKAIKLLFEMDYYFDPYINPKEPYYSIQSYNDDDPLTQKYYGFYFTDHQLGVQLFYQTDTLWFEWEEVKKTLTEKEIFILEVMRKSGYTQFNDLIHLSDTTRNEMNLFAQKKFTQPTSIKPETVQNSKIQYNQYNIRCDWIDTTSVILPENYFTHLEFEINSSSLGLGVIIDTENKFITDGLYYFGTKQQFYAINESLVVFGVRVPIEYLDEVINRNL